ncbi:16S rRNA (uracil(1498)-N(3))-methyltransferase [Pseudohalioglobus lutimaris]|uniref:Ribosomal RNA small subunit methyltransferase E n=1 Tax=Pseudohalioglobus lutimaris TaxID=1737061 RepID=A0A2N5X913_9GAMM|nr:16S rRNA (uracil(1498)-N(3))-methyltransferase [Pseudohalioglobus lutimaris]PLW70980.1 16S rRNA (uracil(1498)-N(3))-methyltransferase [Pseudohalioglobus lutimaris]
MRIPRIFTGQVLQAHSTFELEPRPSQHIARALRMREDDAITLFDGRGGEYPATISALGKKRVAVTTGAHRQCETESTLAIHLGIAVSRGERMDWVIQKATELGVSSISPLLTERTEVKLKGERAEKKVAHWQQIAVSACEQCGRNQIPRIASLQPLQTWLDATEAPLRLVLHHRADPLPPGTATTGQAELLIGPEGGLSESEIATAEAHGFLSLRLGPRVLRTETAPVAALAILQARWGDMSLP